MPGRIQDSLELILATYAEARATEPFGSGSELWDVFNELKEALSTCPSMRRRPDLRVTWSAGKGNWAKVPWVTVLDERETRTTQGGVYCVYLFRQDMWGVYLTFNQGVTEPKNEFGRTKAHEVLRAKAAEVRGLCKGLGERGFRLDDGIDLRAERGLGVDYESSTIARKLYEADRVPDDEVLLGDLEALLGAYDRYLADDKWREALGLCRAYLGDRGSFDARETEYKLRIVGAIREALDPEQAAEGFGQRLRRAFTNSDNNPTNWQAHDRFTRWAIDEQERAREAVRALVSEDKSVEERVDGFLQRVPDEAVSGLGTRVSIASYLLMGVDPENYPFCKPTPFEKVERPFGWPRTLDGESPGEVYAHHRRFAQRFFEELRRAGLEARDLLDVQSLIWILATDDAPAVAVWRGESAEIREPLEAVISWVRNLRTQASPDGRFHYKPLLLLALLDLLDANPGHPNSFGYEELLAAFEALAAERGSSVTEDQFSQPYLRMRNGASPLRVWVPQSDGAGR